MTLLSVRPAIWGGIALSGFLLSTLALLSLHFLRSDFSARHNFISEYAVGPFGYLMTATFLILGLSSLALALCMRATLNIPYIHLFESCLVLTATGLFVMGLCRTDLNDLSPRTRIGSIHDSISVVTFYFALAAMGLFAWKLSFPINSPLRTLQSPTRLLTIGCSLMLVIQLCMVAIQQGHRPYLWVGVPERVLIVLFLLWVCLLSHRLLSIPYASKYG